MVLVREGLGRVCEFRRYEVAFAVLTTLFAPATLPVLACFTYLASNDEKSGTQLHLRTAKVSPRQHRRKAKRDPSEYCGLLKLRRKVAQRLPGPTAYMAKPDDTGEERER